MFTSAGSRKDGMNPFTMLSEDKKKHIIFQEEIDETVEAPALFFERTDTEEKVDLAVDVYNHDEIVIVAQVAGVAKNDIHISVKEDVLTISGEIKKPEGLPHDKRYLHTQECKWGKFSRPIILPQNVDIRRISAKIAHESILILTIPKTKEEDQIIRVEIE